MKKSLYMFFAGAAMLGIGANLYAWDTPATSPTLKMITDAEAGVKGKSVNDLISIYENVLKQKDLAATDRAEICSRIAEALLRQRNPAYKEAKVYFDQISKLADLKPSNQLKYYNAVAKRRFDSNFPSYNQGGIVYSENGIKGGLAVYQWALALKGLSNGEKIDLHNKIANCYFELMDLDAGNAELLKQTKLPGLSDGELASALANQAEGYRRQYDMDKALPIYQKMLDSFPNLHINTRRGYLGYLVADVRKHKGDEQAKAVIRKYDEGAMDRFFPAPKAPENWNAKIKAAEDALVKADEKNKLKAFNDLLSVIDQSNNSKLYDNVWRKYSGNIIKNNREAITKQYENNCSNMLNNWKNQSPLKVLERVKYYRQVLPDSILPLALQAKQHESRRMYPEFVADLKNLLKNKAKLNDKQKAEYEILLDILTSKNGASVAKKITRNCQKSDDANHKTPQYIADQLKNYARYAMVAKKYDMARALWVARDGMIVKHEKPSLKVPFIKDGPRDIAEFLASKHIKDPKNIAVLNRKFGKNLQFLLETDSATTGRVVTKQDDKNHQFTTFTATCDEQGVRLFIMMPASPDYIEKMRYGYGYLGGFETYLSTGYDQPYTCMLIDCPPNTNVYEDFVTMYDNALYRRMMTKNKNISYEFSIKKDQALLLITIDWTAVMNGIPTDGFKWEFEPIHWEKGGWSWGGSESVHNRSSYGDLIFENMTKENVTMIKRRLLSFAKKAYNKENGTHGGLLEHWQDPELGDVAFNEEVIIPFKEKYGKYAAAINENMSDEEVNRIFDESYYTLINTKFVVESLRRDYLERTWVK